MKVVDGGWLCCMFFFRIKIVLTNMILRYKSQKKMGPSSHQEKAMSYLLSILYSIKYQKMFCTIQKIIIIKGVRLALIVDIIK